MQVYREMSDNDPVVGAVLFAITMPVRNLKWRFQAATEDDAGREGKTFAEDVLFKGMTTKWPKVVSNALSMLTYGYALHEIVWMKRPDSSIGILKLAARRQETIFRWLFDEDERGGVVGVEQISPGGQRAIIPSYKLLHFQTQDDRGNPEGRSILRTAYKAYMRKDAIELAEGRAAIRAAGLVTMRIPARYLTPDAGAEEKAVAAAYQDIGAKIAQDRQGSIMLPSDRDAQGEYLVGLEYTIADGRRPTDMTPIIERYDKRIATSVLADFTLLGQQAVGSFALASTKASLFARAIGAIVEEICDVVNDVLLPRLWTLNRFDPVTMPTLVADNLDKMDLAELGTFISQCAAAGMPLFPDTKLENALRHAAGLPAAGAEEVG